MRKSWFQILSHVGCQCHETPKYLIFLSLKLLSCVSGLSCKYSGVTPDTQQIPTASGRPPQVLQLTTKYLHTWKYIYLLVCVYIHLYIWLNRTFYRKMGILNWHTVHSNIKTCITKPHGKNIGTLRTPLTS